MLLIIDSNNGRYSVADSKVCFINLLWTDLKKEKTLPSQFSDLISQNIEGIIVIAGKGSFSETRSAIVFANVFALIKKIPIVEKNEEILFTDSSIKDHCFSNNQLFLKANYRSAPNIT